LKITRNARNSITLHIEFLTNKDWEQWFLLSSDRHHDNPKTRQDLEKKHLDQALERNALIMDFGDLFCAMQGKYDPRGVKSDLRPEHSVNNYFDALVDTSVEFYKPYAKNIVLLGKGNHETSILKRQEIDLNQRLIYGLNNETGSQIVSGGYSGWVQLRFINALGKRNRGGETFNLWYHHGHGGGGPVTKGVIQANRRATFLPDAHLIVGGHVHEEWRVTYQRARLTQNGKPYQDEQLHICLPTYKDEYRDGMGGWHVEKGRPPKPLGAAWLRFYYDRAKDGQAAKHIKFELIRAK
tara:strand:- start:1947 stop:2834 length:888 start_codon:yes stop_codon:yes gene_type:complete